MKDFVNTSVATVAETFNVSETTVISVLEAGSDQIAGTTSENFPTSEAPEILTQLTAFFKSAVHDTLSFSIFGVVEENPVAMGVTAGCVLGAGAYWLLKRQQTVETLKMKGGISSSESEDEQARDDSKSNVKTASESESGAESGSVSDEENKKRSTLKKKK